MAWETSLTNRREGGRNRTRDRKGSSKPEDPAHKREPLTERGFGALAEPRPVLRGLRPHCSPGTCSGGRSVLACRAETRSQGIATAPGPRRRPGSSWPCRAETRSQGIATWKAFDDDVPLAALAEPRPVLRGLRLRLVAHRPADFQFLQSRDPFSGDCDSSSEAPTRTGNDFTLAEPRPVLRGLRRRAAPVVSPHFSPLPCRAETRSQGIATPGSPGCFSPLFPSSLQSRDPFSGDCDGARGHSDVLQGDDFLQSRDPFSGDCDGSGLRAFQFFIGVGR
jgi:hypothetical protein